MFPGPSRALIVASAVATFACHAEMTPRPRPPRTPPQQPRSAPRAAPVAPTGMPDSIHWVRNSAEYRASVIQAFRLATDRAEKAYLGRSVGTWAVVSDADETLLDNSEYQKERGAQGGGFTPETWRVWVTRRSAPSLPGAADFARRVRDLGGRFIVVTNRSDEECPDTEANLRTAGIVVDAVLCRPAGPNPSKQARFDAIAQGRTGKSLPALEIVLWVGDNILDFPDLAQDARSSPDRLSEFGKRYVVIPNPMYGSWERLPRN